MTQLTKIRAVVYSGCALAMLAGWLPMQRSEAGEGRLIGPRRTAKETEPNTNHATTLPDLKPAERLAPPLLDSPEDGPGPSVLGMFWARRPPDVCQVAFHPGPGKMKVHWDVNATEKVDSEPLTCPTSCDCRYGRIYWIRLTEIPGRPKEELYLTLETGRWTPYLQHNAIPFQITTEDLDAVFEGEFLRKVFYLPDVKPSDVALPSVEWLVSKQLAEGVDTISEADHRGTILAIIRMDGERFTWPSKNGAAPLPDTLRSGSGMPIGLTGPPRIPPGGPVKSRCAGDRLQPDDNASM